MRAKQMLATMSHEIRSPLAGVVSMTEILANTKLDKEQHQLLDVMLSSGDLVLQLINDILDLSKVESGNCFVWDFFDIFNSEGGCFFLYSSSWSPYAWFV